LDRVDHEPRQMIRRNPIPDIRRQQKPLLTTPLNEVLRHTGIVITAPDRTPFVKQPRLKATATGPRLHPPRPAPRSARPAAQPREPKATGHRSSTAPPPGKHVTSEPASRSRAGERPGAAGSRYVSLRKGPETDPVPPIP